MALKKELLREHLRNWKEHLAQDPLKTEQDMAQRAERVAFYQAHTADKIRSMSEEELFEYIAKLWAMMIWGNKKYVVDKLIEDHGFKKLKNELAELIWGPDTVDKRWDRFRSTVKGMGPAMMSELLCHAHPEDFILWNRRAYVGLDHLGVDGLPRYNYQLTGKKYLELCLTAKLIAEEMRKDGIPDANLLTVDYFIWDELQVEENLSQLHKPQAAAKQIKVELEKAPAEAAEFLHNEVRDKLEDIGRFLGFTARTEIKVADGSKVDTVWEATIGNMGRVIYVFEVQTKGSIDSLILNLLKSLNNPAVQGVVAVSDAKQIEKIKKHAAGVPQLHSKLKYWDYTQVLEVYEALVGVNESINKLELVPQGFPGI
jgi:hypothetical protein